MPCLLTVGKGRNLACRDVDVAVDVSGLGLLASSDALLSIPDEHDAKRLHASNGQVHGRATFDLDEKICQSGIRKPGTVAATARYEILGPSKGGPITGAARWADGP